MIVLLLFNQNLIWTVEQIHDKTQIQSKLLIQILLGLLKNKLLVSSDIIEDEHIKMNDSIRLATNFKRYDYSLFFKFQIEIVSFCI
jgi:hypothetical protein